MPRLIVKRTVLIVTAPLTLMMYFVGGVLAGFVQGYWMWHRDIIEAWRSRRMGPL